MAYLTSFTKFTNLKHWRQNLESIKKEIEIGEDHNEEINQLFQKFKESLTTDDPFQFLMETNMELYMELNMDLYMECMELKELFQSFQENLDTKSLNVPEFQSPKTEIMPIDSPRNDTGSVKLSGFESVKPDGNSLPSMVATSGYCYCFG